MKRSLRITILFLLAFALSGCIFGGGSSSNRRTLGHVYQDSDGFHIMTLVESGATVSGTARTIGKNDADRPLLVSIGEFDRMWSRLDEQALASYKSGKDAGRFNAADNYVISKGHMRKGGTATYVVPHSEASPELRQWVGEFRTKARTESAAAW
ncbi:hypothetical protein JIN84_21450 [Luteolibacter yonseiensis]|uniref:Lipoprotein n=1 Tax=Luteolibacter yonseiensis TaxID=1144680 RepID=A0A934R746_9BACT|nr:hypothetical protein [Luteolibacter yonseiensis]MBK1818204.1 hypothetical protein [Luteolibacter yonseiensis]